MNSGIVLLVVLLAIAGVIVVTGIRYSRGLVGNRDKLESMQRSLREDWGANDDIPDYVAQDLLKQQAKVRAMEKAKKDRQSPL